MNSKRWSLIGVIYFIQLECFSSWLSLQFDVFYTRCGKKIKWFSYIIWKTTFVWVFEPILWVCWMNVVRIEMERYHYEITLLNISQVWLRIQSIIDGGNNPKHRHLCLCKKQKSTIGRNWGRNLSWKWSHWALIIYLCVVKTYS